MDIKSKNSKMPETVYGKTEDGRKNIKKKKSFLALAALVILAEAGFMALYPEFQKKADLSYESVLQGDDFLQTLYKSNYVLYKDIADKTGGTNKSYAELYLETEETDAAGQLARSSGRLVGSAAAVLEDGIDEYTETVKGDVEARLSAWENEVSYLVSEKLDYCVIDDLTGQSIRNTGRNIEALGAAGNDAEREKLPYVYYVRMSYDGAGNVEKVGVKDENADELLKRVQRIMKSELLESQLNYINANKGGSETWYGYGETEDTFRQVTYRIKKPRNVTFIYAMTKEQVSGETGGEWSPVSNRWEEWSAYYSAGVANIIDVFLILLAVICFLLMHWKSYCLHRLSLVKIPLEISGFVAALLYVTGAEAAVRLVSDTNRGYLGLTLQQWLPFLPDTLLPAAAVLVNIFLLTLLFGGWLYCVNAWGEVTVVGVLEFIRTRSLLARLWLGLTGFCRKHYGLFKEELLHADLGKKTDKTLRKAVTVNALILAVISSLWFFGWAALLIYTLFLYYVLKRFIHRIRDQYGKLLQATGAIADGDLDTSFDEDLGVFESYKEELYKIQEGFRRAVDEEVKSQRMKAELITNVSHDLKTPLTAITTYIDLLKEENITEEQRREYIGVLERKSLRLKSLIEDLFEVSKANSKNVTVNLADVDICSLMRQVYLEYEERVEEAGLIFRFRMPEEKVVLRLDSQKTCRIFENLYINIIKYAMPDTRVYVGAERTDEGIRIELKNMSATELAMDPEELTERFVRGDSSRNTEGNGLGLAIARSFTELQGGRMTVGIDGDLFKVTLEWQI